ncbi:MAG: hypothetical protein RR051_06795, partial [Clostridiales bacterium]
NPYQLSIDAGVITDTLPAYFDVDGENFYQIYHGTQATGTDHPKITRGDLLNPAETAALLKSVTVNPLDGNSKQIIFELNDFSDRYVILIKTKLSQENAAKLFLSRNSDIP